MFLNKYTSTVGFLVLVSLYFLYTNDKKLAHEESQVKSEK